MSIWKAPGKGLGFGLLATLLLSLGCGGGEESTTPAVQDLIQQGWHWFENQQVDSAYAAFGEAVSRDPSNAEAWLGIGWASLRLYDPVYAHQSFLRALNLGGDSLDAWAGLAIADADPLPDPTPYGMPLDSVLLLAVTASQQVLGRDSAYRFSHDPTVTATLLLLEEARALCSLGRFADALVVVQQLDPEFWVDVSTPEGRAALLERIAELLGGQA